jgi:D-2-hydroxyacid dehydrogenase (NADP+)
VHPPEALAQLLPSADFVVLTCPLTEATTGLIGEPQLRRMKASASLINCARGAVVVEDALITALEQGTIAAAAVDVVAEAEPLPADSPLWAAPNLLITPHTGAASDASFWAAVLAEIYLCNVCSYQETLRRNERG